MKKLMIFSFFILSAAFFTGCSGDDDNVEEVEAGVFDLTLQNNTDSEVVIFLRGAELTAGFENSGSIPAGGETVLEELSVRQSYVVRASFTDDATQYFYEETVFRDSPTDLTLEIDE